MKNISHTQADDREKLVKYGFIGLAILIVAFIVIIINFAYTNSRVNRLVAQTESVVNERVGYSVKQYLSSYLSEEEESGEEKTTVKNDDSKETMQTETIEKNSVSIESATNPVAPVTLTQKQIDSITEIVVQSTKKELIKEVLVETATSDMDARLDAFEKEIMQKVTEVLNKYSTATGGLTEAERTSLINSISAIVKSDILSTVKENYYDINAANIEALRKSIESNLASIQQQFDSYDVKFNTIKTQIKNLSSTITAGATDTVALEEQMNSINRQLVSLTAEYNAFTAKALTTSMIVDDLTKNVEEGVVSAKVGQELQRGLQDTRTELQQLISILNQTAKQLSNQITHGDAYVMDSVLNRMLTEDKELQSKLIYQMTTGDADLQERLLEQMVSGDASLQENLLLQITHGDMNLQNELQQLINNGDITLKELLKKEIEEGDLTLQAVLEKQIESGDITLRDILTEQINSGDTNLKEFLLQEMLAQDSDLESRIIYQMTNGDSVLQESLLEQIVAGDDNTQNILLEQITHGDATLEEQLKEQIANGDTTLKELLMEEISTGNLTLQEVLEKQIAEGDLTLRDILNRQMEEGNLTLQELIKNVDQELSEELQEQVNLLNENITMTESNLSGDIQDLGDSLSNVNASLSSTLNQITSALGADELSNYTYSTTVLTRIAAMELNMNNASTDIAGMKERILALETTVEKLSQQFNLNVKSYDSSTKTLIMQSVSIKNN